MSPQELEWLELGPPRTALPVPAVTRLPNRHLLIDRCKLGCKPQIIGPDVDLDPARVWIVHAEVGP